MKTIATCSNLAEVALVRSLLESEGIEVLVPQENTPAPIGGFPGGFQVQVPEELAARAVELLHSAGPRPDAATDHPGPPGIPASRLTMFRCLVILEAALALGIWLNAQQAHDSLPSDIRDYLDTLAASPGWWTLGYYVFLAGVVVSQIGSLLLLFRSRLGLWTFTSGILIQLLSTWVFPGGITYGVASMLSCLELLLAGGIVGWAFADRSLLASDS